MPFVRITCPRARQLPADLDLQPLHAFLCGQFGVPDHVLRLIVHGGAIT